MAIRRRPDGQPLPGDTVEQHHQRLADARQHQLERLDQWVGAPGTPPGVTSPRVTPWHPSSAGDVRTVRVTPLGSGR